MISILFVDDEAAILEGLQVQLRRQRRQWKMQFAHGGPAGVEAIRTGQFDVVVSDMRMPEIDGIGVLRAAREHQPDALRLVLSGYGEHRDLCRALAVSHQFLSKPCSVDELKRTIECGQHARALVTDEELRTAVTRLGDLPALPRLYQELCDLLESGQGGSAEIATVVEQDVALSVRLLALVNSSWCGLSREIVALSDAVSYLGIETIRSLVLVERLFDPKGSTATASTFRHTEAMQRALQTGRLARRLLAREDQGDVFASALLHDVGELALAMACPEAYDRSVRLAADEGLTRCEAERRVIGATHAQLGAYLLRLWDLPLAFVEAAAHHHVPSESSTETFDTLAAVHIAQWLVAEVHSIPTEPLDDAFLSSCGVETELDRWRELAQREVAEPAGSV